MTALVAILVSVLAAGSPPARQRIPVLVELFTSEGCSSCPPADAVLRQLVEQQPVPGARVIALGEHVDYWDELGWQDPFSSRTFSQRQAEYERRLGVSAPYTPQLVIGGRAQVVGSDIRSARRAIDASASKPEGSVTLEVVSRSADTARVRVNASWTDGLMAEVRVALVQARAVSMVTRGENAGRSLTHVAIARMMTTVGTGSGSYASTAALDITAPGVTSAVAFVQERGGGRVLAVESIDLAP